MLILRKDAKSDRSYTERFYAWTWIGLAGLLLELLALGTILRKVP